MRLATTLAACLALAAPVAAQEVVADLSQSNVAITASFAGSQIVVFGAVKHAPDEVPLSYPVLHPLDVIVTVAGPAEPVTVRKKERHAGIWVNARSFEVGEAPALYKVASSQPLARILTPEEIERHRIAIPQAIRPVENAGSAEDAEAFTEALIRIRTREGLYDEMPGSVRLLDQTLFRTDISLPSNLVEGEYTTRIFLTRNKRVVAEFSRTLDVHKVGIERWVYNLAQEQALLYGLLSLALAIAAGWGASAAFRYARGS
ncbi:MAG: TIGR02186 family protein [Tropicimonas sp.]|uniref:TIGR02186 family protein n=1 Tax=Tropicimonas sp. TaxID=2067044 RepID=UPI003A8A1B5C